MPACEEASIGGRLGEVECPGVAVVLQVLEFLVCFQRSCKLGGPTYYDSLLKLSRNFVTT